MKHIETLLLWGREGKKKLKARGALIVQCYQVATELIEDIMIECFSLGQGSGIFRYSEARISRAEYGDSLIPLSALQIDDAPAGGPVQTIFNT